MSNSAQDPNAAEAAQSGDHPMDMGQEGKGKGKAAEVDMMDEDEDDSNDDEEEVIAKY